MEKKTSLWKQNRELKRKVKGIREINNRMWKFIVDSGLKDRYDTFCECGEVDNVQCELTHISGFLFKTGLSDDYSYYKLGGEAFNYKSNLKDWANRFLEQESVYTKMMLSLDETIAKLWDKLLNNTQKELNI